MQNLLSYRFGVNYTPTQNWFFCWNDFDANSIARDLDSIASIGADHLRMMAIWPYFQPNPRWVSPAHLDHMDTFMTLAGERKLDVCMTLLNGFVSGYFFLPHFARLPHLYDASLRPAIEFYFRAMGERLNKHPNFMGVDLGNELNCCWQSATTDIGDEWMRWVFQICRESFPGRIHVNGVDHQPWFDPRTYSPAALTKEQAIVALHCWPEFTGAHKRGGPMDPPAEHLAAAMTALARTYAHDPAKPVWIQEYGSCKEWLTETEIAEWLTRYTRSAIDSGASWFTWWDSHDLNPKFDFTIYEYSLGLFTNDNQPKPQAMAFRKLTEEFRGKRVPADLLKSPTLAPPKEHSTEDVWTWLTDWIGANRS